LENLDVLAEKVLTLGVQSDRRNRCGAAKKRTRKARIAEALTGTQAAASLGRFEAANYRLCRSPEHLGPRLKGRRR
jgi:hypothetical protein